MPGSTVPSIANTDGGAKQRSFQVAKPGAVGAHSHPLSSSVSTPYIPTSGGASGNGSHGLNANASEVALGQGLVGVAHNRANSGSSDNAGSN